MGNNIANFGEGFLDPIREVRPPLATDNTYQVGQPWIDTVADIEWVLLDVTAGVATWGVSATTSSSGGLPYTTATDPASPSDAVTTAIIDAFGGTVITTTAAGNAQTLEAPTDTTPGREFVVANADVSTDPITVNGVVLQPAEAQKYIWDGASWTLGTGIDASHIDLVPASWYVSTKVQAGITELAGAIKFDAVVSSAIDVTLASTGWDQHKNVYMMDTSTAALSFTLPPIAGVNDGWRCKVKHDGYGSLNILTDGAETIDGYTSLLSTSKGRCFEFIKDGSNWKEIS